MPPPHLFLQLLNINQVSVELEITFLSSSVVFLSLKNYKGLFLLGDWHLGRGCLGFLSPHNQGPSESHFLARSATER